jgi:hypothetical protein
LHLEPIEGRLIPPSCESDFHLDTDYGALMSRRNGERVTSIAGYPEKLRRSGRKIFRCGGYTPFSLAAQFQDPVVKAEKAGPMTDADVGSACLSQECIQESFVGDVKGACRLVEGGVAGLCQQQPRYLPETNPQTAIKDIHGLSSLFAEIVE